MNLKKKNMENKEIIEAGLKKITSKNTSIMRLEAEIAEMQIHIDESEGRVSVLQQRISEDYAKLYAYKKFFSQIRNAINLNSFLNKPFIRTKQLTNILKKTTR